MKQLETRREVLNRVAAKRRWYDIANKDGDVAEIRIYDEISWWGLTAEDFARELDDITADEIVVKINSPGGDVFDGIAIYNALRAHPAKITTRVDGIAASIASVIAQAGDHRIMLSASQMMIHDAWGLAIGNAGDMREMADLLDRQSDNIAGIYAARGTGDSDHYRALMAKETFLTDAEAVAEGLADEVIDPSSTEKSDAATSARLAKKTLSDEVTEAMDVVSKTLESAQRVAALRAEKGKDLSQVNRASLDELESHMEQLRALLNDATRTEDEGDDATREYARFVELSVAIP